MAGVEEPPDTLPLNTLVSTCNTPSNIMHQSTFGPVVGTASFPQFILGAHNPISGQSEPPRKSCALCRKANCSRATSCKGAGARKHCTCGHPALAPGERVRVKKRRLV
jgi:hypothetical protein